MMRVAALCTLIGNIAIGTAALTGAGVTLGTTAEANPLPAAPAPVDAVAEASSMTRVEVIRSLRPQARRVSFKIPDARWDGNPGRRSWSVATLKALRTHASVLPDVVPKDIAAYCPAYPTASRSQREAFWVGLISSLAWHESTHRPTAVGGGKLWYGLTQIYPDTARRYGCKAKTGEALKDPEDNLSCALRIMAVTVPRDRVVSAGMRGVAADWGPFHSRRKREDIMSWTRSQSYCQGLSRSLKPVARPATGELMARVRLKENEVHLAKLAELSDLRPRARDLERVAAAPVAKAAPDARDSRIALSGSPVAPYDAAVPRDLSVIKASHSDLGTVPRPKARPAVSWQPEERMPDLQEAADQPQRWPLGLVSTQSDS
jgi:hypothetical protein